MAIDKALIDQLLADYKKPEDIIGENGLLKQLTKAILERALQAELTDHLGFEKHDPTSDPKPLSVSKGCSRFERCFRSFMNDSFITIRDSHVEN